MNTRNMIIILSLVVLGIISAYTLTTYSVYEGTFQGDPYRDYNPVFYQTKSSWGYEFSPYQLKRDGEIICTGNQCNDGYISLVSQPDPNYGSIYHISFTNVYDWLNIIIGDDHNFIQGTPGKLKVYVKNNFRTLNDPGWVTGCSAGACPPSAVLCLDAYWTTVEPFTGQTIYKDVSRCNEQIALGENIFLFDVPMSAETGTYFFNFQPVIYTKDDSSPGYYKEWARMWIYPEMLEYKIQVIPQPIYIVIDCLTNPCPGGYTCQEESGLCLRNDIIEKGLTCQELGCPSTPDMTYACTSSGICAEVIFQYLDCVELGYCPLGFTCEPTSGMCIKTEIIKELVQCETPDDCMKPCDGLTIECIDNLCTYTGECDIKIIQCIKHTDCPPSPCIGVDSICMNNQCIFSGSCDPTYLKIDCSVEGGTCPDGYICDTSMTPAVCKREIYYYIDCTIKNDDGTTRYPCPEGYFCDDINKVCVKKLTLDCSTLGCPEGYTCDSKGYCKKELIQGVSCDVLGCPTDYVCDEESGACYKALYVDCTLMGCPQGYVCEDDGTCTQTITSELNCNDLGCPQGYDCDKTLGVCKGESEFIIPSTWIIVGFVILILISIIIVLMVRRR